MSLRDHRSTVERLGRLDFYLFRNGQPELAPVLVVGDVMLDVYVAGSVDRVSPEAPIPVLRQSARRTVPGGAANVAANIAGLGGQAKLLACAGDDEERTQLERLLLDAGVACEFVVDGSRPTTVKTRFMANQHQLLRVDRENLAPLSAGVEDALIDRIEHQLQAGGVLILSDYNKGVLTDRILSRSIELARSRGALVLIDPKRGDFRCYRGASYIKPNRTELANAAGRSTLSDSDIAAAALEMVKLTGASLLVTRAEQGMSLASAAGGIVHMATHAREVYDVSGAGDTAMAAFAVGLHSGWSETDAMLFANIAAGIAVSKVGTSAITRKEVLAEYRRLSQDQVKRGTLVSRTDAMQLRNSWKYEGLKVGFTNGCFDLLHPGHIKVLQEAAKHCDRLIVGLNSDSSVRRLKGISRPVQGEADRAAVLGALEAVSLVVIFSEDTPRELIDELRPDVLVKGADYKIDQIVGADLVLGAGGKVLAVDLLDGRSTTNLIRRSGAEWASASPTA